VEAAFGVKLFKGNMAENVLMITKVVAKNPNSFFWKAIVKTLPKMFISEVRVVRDGITIKFLTI
jgi:hypothetical protein